MSKDTSPGGADRGQERNLLYVIEAETFVSKTLRPFLSDTVEDTWYVTVGRRQEAWATRG